MSSVAEPLQSELSDKISLNEPLFVCCKRLGVELDSPSDLPFVLGYLLTAGIVNRTMSGHKVGFGRSVRDQFYTFESTYALQQQLDANVQAPPCEIAVRAAPLFGQTYSDALTQYRVDQSRRRDGARIMITMMRTNSIADNYIRTGLRAGMRIDELMRDFGARAHNNLSAVERTALNDKEVSNNLRIEYMALVAASKGIKY